MHIGHYSSFLISKRLAKYGHKPILLVGGATGLIGDPRPTAEREILDYSVIEENIKGICDKCGCVLKAKTKSNSKCPLNKW